MTKTDQILLKLKGLDVKTQYGVLAALLAVVVVLDVLMPMRAQLSGIAALRDKSAQLTRDIRAVEDNQQRMGVFRQQLANLQLEIADLSDTIREKQEVPLILDDISRIASQQNMKIDQLRPLSESLELLLESTHGKYYGLLVLVEGHGSYHDLGRFIAQMENERVFFNMHQLKISQNASDMKRHNVQLVLQAIIHEKPHP